MTDCVLIKGNKHGLSIQMDRKASMEEIKASLQKKLEDGKGFFGNAKVSVSFKGRELAADDKDILTEIIRETSDLEIFCVVDDSVPAVREIEKTVEKTIEKVVFTDDSKLIKGTLRSGQEIHAKKDIVVFGDVNPGAKVSAGGNIIILGSLKGQVHAGFGGAADAVVFALDMKPTQIRIGNVIARSPDKIDKKKTVPHVAFVEEEAIVLEPYKTNIFTSINN